MKKEIFVTLNPNEALVSRGHTVHRSKYKGLNSQGEYKNSFNQKYIKNIRQRILEEYSKENKGMTQEQMKQVKKQIVEWVNIDVYDALERWDFYENWGSNTNKHLDYICAMINTSQRQEGETKNQYKERVLKQRAKALENVGIRVECHVKPTSLARLRLLRNARKIDNFMKTSVAKESFEEEVKDPIQEGEEITDVERVIRKKQEAYQPVDEAFMNDEVLERIEKESRDSHKDSSKQVKVENKGGIDESTLEELRRDLEETKENSFSRSTQVEQETGQETKTPLEKDTQPKVKIDLKIKNGVHQKFKMINTRLKNLKDMTNKPSFKKKAKKRIAQVAAFGTVALIGVGLFLNGQKNSERSANQPVQGRKVAVETRNISPISPEVSIQQVLKQNEAEKLNFMLEGEVKEIKSLQEMVEQNLEEENHKQEEKQEQQVEKQKTQEEKQEQQVEKQKTQEEKQEQQVEKQKTQEEKQAQQVQKEENQKDEIAKENLVNFQDTLMEILDIGFNSQISNMTGQYYETPEGTGNYGSYENINGTIGVSLVDVIEGGNCITYSVDDHKNLSQIKREHPNAEKFSYHMKISETGEILGWDPSTSEVEKAMIRTKMMQIKPYLSQEAMQFLVDNPLDTQIDANKNQEVLQEIHQAVQNYQNAINGEINREEEK